MISPETQSQMWADLFTSENDAKSAQHKITTRALFYMQAGLELDQVLDALKISRATWYRRVEALHAWRCDNREASERIRMVPDADVEDYDAWREDRRPVRKPTYR